jgi:hypothetical protein
MLCHYNQQTGPVALEVAHDQEEKQLAVRIEHFTQSNEPSALLLERKAAAWNWPLLTYWSLPDTKEKQAVFLLECAGHTELTLT